MDTSEVVVGRCEVCARPIVRADGVLCRACAQRERFRVALEALLPERARHRRQHDAETLLARSETAFRLIAEGVANAPQSTPASDGERKIAPEDT